MVDTKNPDVVYVMNTSVYRSTDGGTTFARAGRALRAETITTPFGSTPPTTTACHLCE